MNRNDFPTKLWLAANQNIKERKYWLEKLSGELVKSYFPYDFQNRGMKQLEVLESDKLKITGELFSKVEAVSKSSAYTLHIILTSVLIVLINKYIGNQDIIVGTPIYKKAFFGNFINTVLALRTQITANTTFKELLLQVKQTVLQANENQDFPFEILLKQLNMPLTGTNASCPLFDTIILLENIHHKQYIQHINTNVTFSFLGTDEYIEGIIEFNSSLYSRETMARIANHFKNTLERALSNLDTKIAELDILTSEEKNQLLDEFNDTKTDYPRNKTIQEIFQEHVEKTPDFIALLHKSRQLTYKELNGRANQLARVLRRKGVGANCIVGVLLERSIGMIIGLLGILKAGGAYLPLEVETPQKRIVSMLEDCQSPILLTGSDSIASYSFTGSQKVQRVICREVVMMDTIYDALTEESLQDLKTVNRSGDLAYTIFTSGSTGKPKGTFTTHANVTRVVKNTNYIELTAADRILQLSNYAFDGSVFDIYGALLNGSALVLMKKNEILTLDRLAHLIEKESITVFFNTTALFNTLVDIQLESLRQIRKILFGGERVSVEHTRKALDYLGENKILHVYGPTETTVYATYYPVNRIDERYETIPIGKPISNTTTYILDNHLSPLPLGAIGQIYIGGEGSAIGYLNNPELTAERFIPHPFVKNDRLYLTGDLGKQLPDGNIEFIGRIDQQVKIRGFRIELAEIKNHLVKLDAINDAVVMAKENPDGERYLCAYIIPKPGIDEPDIPGLKEKLLKDLPAYMVPAYFVPLAEMPLTPNGKVDKRALPEPAADDGGTAYAAPRDQVEEKFVKIWSEILEIETGTIGIDHDFFELGGHSLKAVTLISKLHQSLDVKIPVAEIFRTPTIRALAGFVKNAASDTFTSIKKVEEKEYYKLSSAQKRLYVLQQMEVDSTAYNVPMVYVLEGKWEPGKMEETSRKLIDRHEGLRTSFIVVNEEPVQVILPVDEVEFEIVYYLATEGTENTGGTRGLAPLSKEPSTRNSQLATSTIKNFIRPFDLYRAPLLRVGVINLGEERNLLMVDMHHIITDGISMALVIKEFAALSRGEELKALRIQYKDYSEWQNSEMQQQTIRKQKKYWLKQFEAGIPVLQLPLDYSRPSVRSFEGNTLDFELSPQLTRSLNHLASENEATLFIVLLAIYNILLSKMSGQEDIVVGTSVAGRRHADLEHIAGMLVNNLALRNFPGPEKTFITFLKEVKERTLEAFENQDYPFEDLVESVVANRDTGRNPLFDTLLSLQNMAANTATVETSPGEIAGLKIKPYEIEHQTAKFDIQLACIEAKDKIYCAYEYCTKLFRKNTIQQFIIYFKKLVLHITENPEKKISEIEIISEEEKKQLLEKVDPTNLDHQGERLLLTSKFMKQRAYWLKRLSPGIEKTEPFLKRKVEKGEELDSIQILIPGQLFNRMLKLGKQSDLSLYLILLAALKVLIYRYTTHEDVIVISPVYKGNVSRETLNQRLFIRDRIGEELTFADLLLEIRKSVLEAYENQDYPSTKLIEYLQGTPGLKTDTDTAAAHIACLLSNIHDTKGFDRPGTGLIFSFHKEENQLKGHILYDRILYEKGYIQLISKYLVNILDNSTKDIKTKIPGISFLSKEEKKRFIIDFNRTDAPYPEEKTLVELFEEQVERTPEQIALVAQSENEKRSALGAGRSALTYREFNEKSNQLAHRLRTRGVKADTIVGIMAERSLPMLIGIMAILKAGGAFLPIDIGYPLPRQTFILEDSEAALLLTQAHLLEKDKENMKTYPCQDIVLIASDEQATPPGKYDNPGVIHHPLSLAYVIYTSGTSGKPKGVMIPHRALVNYIWWAAQHYVKEQTVHFPLYTSISFDLTMTSIFTPLITGNAIVIYREEEEPLLIGQVLADDKVGVIKCTPSHLKLITYTGEEISSRNIKRFVVGGEKLERDLALEIHKKFKGNIEIYNEYGPTEATVGCMIYKFDPQYQYPGVGSVPIGKPINNTQVYILDRHLCPVPIGVPGELCISGEGVARGYLNRPGLTAGRFLFGPYSFYRSYRSHRSYIYKTGDLARRLPDGNIECLGRMDNQVKIRGFRIEVEEITDHLLKYTGIKEAMVVAKSDESGDHFLCAYIVPGNKTGLEIPGLREYLSEVLPIHMVPDYFVLIDKIPLTVNGKVDRRALPEPNIQSGFKYVAPRTPLEEKLAAIWSEVLGVEKDIIGIETNFFELGGNSLKATVLIARIHKALDVKLPLVEVFKTTDIKGLAQYINKTGEEKFISLPSVEKKDYYPMSSAQKRLYVLQQMEVDSTAYNMPQVIPLLEEPNMKRLEDTFFRLINRHESLRTSFHMIDDEPVQRVHDEVEFEIEYYDFQVTGAGDRCKWEEVPFGQINAFGEETTGHHSSFIIHHSFIRPFDLSQAPLLRVGLLKGEQKKYLLMVDMHHIISDGVSHQLLVNDFTALDKGQDLYPLRIQYKDFSQWQNSAKLKAVIKQQEDYWQREFGIQGEIPVLNLPTDYPRPAIQSFEGNSVSFDITREETKSLSKMALEQGTTMFMVLLAMTNILFSKLCGQEDIVIGSPIAGRRHADLEKIIGMFVNTLALRSFPAGEKTFREFLNEMKERTLEAFEHQDYQFEDLVEKVVVNRDVSRNPLFDVMFIWQDIKPEAGSQSNDTTDIPVGTQAEQNSSPSHNENILQTAKFDLTLSAVEVHRKLVLSFHYCTKLFKKETIERFIYFFKKIVSTVLENREKKISEINIISDREKRKIMEELNHPLEDYPLKSVVKLFEDQVKKKPDITACFDEGKHLTFNVLNHRADVLAELIKEL